MPTMEEMFAGAAAAAPEPISHPSAMMGGSVTPMLHSHTHPHLRAALSHASHSHVHGPGGGPGSAPGLSATPLHGHGHGHPRSHPHRQGPPHQPAHPSSLSIAIPESDNCAGCNATGVSLLACDDFEGTGGQRARFCPNCMIGKKVRVFWPVNNKWYMGTVEQYSGTTGEHMLRYDDDDTEWVKIGESNTTAPQEEIPGSIRQGGDAPLSNRDIAKGSLGTPNATGRAASPTESTSRGAPSPVSPSNSHPSGLRDSPTTTSGGVHPSHVYSHEQQGAVPVDGKWQTGASRPPPGSGMPSMHPPGAFPPYVAPNSHGMYPPHAGYRPPHHQGSPFPGYPPQPSLYGYPPNAAQYGMGPDRHAKSPGSSSPTSSGAGSKRKNGPKAWTKEEDALLLNIVQSMRMPMKWSIVAQSLPGRTGKQCRERYVNHLNPRLKVTDWSPIEDATIFHLYNTIGSHWAKMSKMIPGRTDNGIKNRFHNLRRQLEREDEHRLRLSTNTDFPEEIRMERLREFPDSLKGRTADLWDINSGIGVLAGQSVLVGSLARSAGRFGPFRPADAGDTCVRCGFLVPSVHTGNELCTKTGWCQTCVRIPPHVSGAMLRECLNLRRSQDKKQREVVESWEDPYRQTKQ